MAKDKRGKYDAIAERLVDVAAIDNEGSLWSVVLYLMPTDGSPRWVLKILDTPGRWYLGSLLETFMKSHGQPYNLAIDARKGWNVTNIGEILLSAVDAI